MIETPPLIRDNIKYDYFEQLIVRKRGNIYQYWSEYFGYWKKFDSKPESKLDIVLQYRYTWAEPEDIPEIDY